jgi:predicted DNA-binding protein
MFKYLTKTIRAYLEDQQDYRLAVAALERNEETFSIEEIRKELSLMQPKISSHQGRA